MNTQTIVIGLVALILGGVGGYTLNRDAAPPPSAHTMEAAMASMSASLKDKTGDDFDRAFLAEMTAHHHGAIEMAQLALENAKHPEIRTMAEAIISAQDTEIKQMQAWQAAWYGESSHEEHAR